MTKPQEGSPVVERRMLRERRFPASLIPVLANLKVSPRPGSYCVVQVAQGAALPFAAADARRLSVAWGDSSESFILPESEWAQSAGKASDADVDKGYRVLTLSKVPDGHEGQFMAVVTGMLADALVNARPVWSPGKFDLVVKATDLKQTRDAIELIVDRAKGRLRGTQEKK